MTPLSTSRTEEGTMKLLFKPEEFPRCSDCKGSGELFDDEEEEHNKCDECDGTGRKLPEVGDSLKWTPKKTDSPLEFDNPSVFGTVWEESKVLSVRVVTADEWYDGSDEKTGTVLSENIEPDQKLIEVEVDD